MAPILSLGTADIRQHISLFHMLFDAIQIGISITDASGVIVYCNSALLKIDNVTADDILEKRMCEVYDFTENESPAMQVLRTGQMIVDRVNSYSTRSGNLVNASCTIYPLLSQEKMVCGVICYTQNYTLLNTHFQNVQNELAKTAPDTDHAQLRYTFDSIIGNNSALKHAVEKSRHAANGSSPVMLVGETGVGKELFAQSIHGAGARRQGAYTAINCSAIPETLLEGILFGTTKGAFTGAVNRQGLFEISNGGTLFLDEVDSMPIGLQSKLLRVLQEQQVRRVGDTVERRVDVRVISAVGRNPAELLEQKLLRPDLYYRLGVIKVSIPPLRERMDDLELLTGHFLDQVSRKLFRPVPDLSEEAQDCLHRHAWPGNVRELEHVLEAVLSILEQQMEIRRDHIAYACPELTAVPASAKATQPPSRCEQPAPPQCPTDKASTGPDPVQSVSRANKPLASAAHEAELAVICKALKTTAGKQALAARLLGISPQLLRYKLKKYQCRIEDFIPEWL